MFFRVNLLADPVLLAVQLGLILLGDVAPILGGHVALLLADVLILLVELLGLAWRELAALLPLLDTLVLVGEAPVDLSATGMVLLPLGLLGEGAGRAQQDSRYD